MGEESKIKWDGIVYAVGSHIHTMVLQPWVRGLTCKYAISVGQSGIGNLTSTAC